MHTGCCLQCVLTGGEEFPCGEAVQVGDDSSTADVEADHCVRQSVAVQRHYLLEHDQHLTPSRLRRGRGRELNKVEDKWGRIERRGKGGVWTWGGYSCEGREMKGGEAGKEGGWRNEEREEGERGGS